MSKRGERISRRHALFAAFGAGTCACRSRGESSKPVVSSSPALVPTPDWGELEVLTLGDMQPAEQGGTAVVLLHGFRARGDDLASLARRLARRNARFFLPAAPLVESDGGRAWWRLMDADRPEYASSDEIPPEFRPHPQVLRARAAVQAVLKTIRLRFAPRRLMLAGFSQGGMLAVDVALAGEPHVDGAASLSGVLLQDSLPALRAERGRGTKFFVSHGRHDSVLEFSGSERLRDMLATRGFSVDFHAFDGGHRIPPEVVRALGTFLFDDR